MKKYQVMYNGYWNDEWYGESDSLTGAKRIATNHARSRYGYEIPYIYLADDVVLDGKKHRIKRDAIPIATKWNGHWFVKQEV